MKEKYYSNYIRSVLVAQVVVHDEHIFFVRPLPFLFSSALSLNKCESLTAQAWSSSLLKQGMSQIFFDLAN